MVFVDKNCYPCDKQDPSGNICCQVKAHYETTTYQTSWPTSTVENSELYSLGRPISRVAQVDLLSSNRLVNHAMLGSDRCGQYCGWWVLEVRLFSYPTLKHKWQCP